LIKSFWKDYESGAELSKENSIQLRNISNDLSGNKVTQPMALFCQYSAVEEMNKAIMLLLAHREFLNKGIADKILSDHKVKSFLFREIYHGNSSLEHNKILIDGKELTWENITFLIKKHNDRHKQRFDLRNKWLYVDRDEKLKKWTTPKDFIENFNAIKSGLVLELQALVTFYGLLKKMSFDTQIDNFQIESKLDEAGFLKTMSFRYDEV